MQVIEWDDFQKVDIRVGTVTEVRDFPEAKKPAYILKVDFGPDIGIKISSAQITDLYKKEKLLGKQVIAVVNFPPKQIGQIKSECLITGFYNREGKVVLAVPDKEVQPGTKLA